MRAVQGALAGPGESCGGLCRQGVELAKLDVDKEKFIATQFQIRSIPTVYAIYQGQPVADLTTVARNAAQADARPATRAVQDRAAKVQPAEIEPLIAMGEQVLAEGDVSVRPTSSADRRDGARKSGSNRGLVRALIAAGGADERAAC